MKRLMSAAATCVLAACATTQGTKETAAKKGEPVMEKMVIINVIPFDVASCGPRTLDLTPLTTEAVLGALLSMGPAFQECFVDAKSVEGAVDAKLKATVGTEATYEITGTGLSASGKACITNAAKKLPFKQDAAAKPIVVELPLQPGTKSVVFGTNAASDAVGTIRLAQPQLCECYKEIGTKAPPVMVAKVLLSKEKPADITIEPNEAQTVSDCVAGKLKTLTLPQADVQLPYQFLLKNAYSSEVTATAMPALQFQQYDGAREQRTADVLIAAGKRGNAAVVFQGLATKYNEKHTASLIPELKTKCAALGTTDDAWLASLGALKANYESSLSLVQTEKAKDAAAWSPVEERLVKQVADIGAEITRAEGVKKNDQNACPKTKY